MSGRKGREARAYRLVCVRFAALRWRRAAAAVEGVNAYLKLAAAVLLRIACARLKAASGNFLCSVSDLGPARTLGLCLDTRQRQLAVVAQLCAILDGEVLRLSNERPEGSD